MQSDRHIDQEIAEIFETNRSMLRITINLSAILTTANITLIGFAVANKSSFLVFLGSFFPLVYMAFLIFMYKVFVSLTLSAMRLEKFSPDGALFASTVVSLIMPSTYHKLLKINKISNRDEQLDELRNTYATPFTPFTHLLVPTWIFVQVVGSFCLWHFFDWPLISVQGAVA